MKYTVTYKVDARYSAEVEANSIEEAKKIAESNFWDADFGNVFDIDGEPILIEDEKKEIVWEKE